LFYLFHFLLFLFFQADPKIPHSVRDERITEEKRTETETEKFSWHLAVSGRRKKRKRNVIVHNGENEALEKGNRVRERSLPGLYQLPTGSLLIEFYSSYGFQR